MCRVWRIIEQLDPSASFSRNVLDRSKDWLAKNGFRARGPERPNNASATVVGLKSPLTPSALRSEQVDHLVYLAKGALHPHAWRSVERHVFPLVTEKRSFAQQSGAQEDVRVSARGLLA
jgi:hypothetical protein